MTKITVKKLVTSNNTPTLTGTVEFQRFSAPGQAKESIEVYVNYVPYRLFEGNLGLDETKTPNEWKLTFDSPLFAGTYDVEAIVYDIATNQILASDETVDELTITAPENVRITVPSYNLRQRYQRLNSLMESVNLQFGGKSGLTPLPSVHPTLDDQSTTALPAGGNEERSEDPRAKSKDKTRMIGAALPPQLVQFLSTDPGKGAGPNSSEYELPSTAQSRDTLGKTNQLTGDEAKYKGLGLEGLDAADRQAVLSGGLTKAEKAALGK